MWLEFETSFKEKQKQEGQCAKLQVFAGDIMAIHVMLRLHMNTQIIIKRQLFVLVVGWHLTSVRYNSQ